MDFVPALIPLALALIVFLGVARPMGGARRASVLADARGRAITTAILLAVVAMPVFALGVAGEARERAAAQPPGPGWSPDAGLGEVSAAAGLGALAALLVGPTTLVMLVLDGLARRRLGRAASGALKGTLDVGLGEALHERPRPLDYRTDATPDVAVRGDLDLGKRLLGRAILAHSLAVLLVGAMFLMLALVALSAATY